MTTILLSSACAPAPEIHVNVDPCLIFTPAPVTDAQVDDAKRSAESKKIWRPLFDWLNTYSDTREAQCPEQ